MKNGLQEPWWYAALAVVPENFLPLAIHSKNEKSANDSPFTKDDNSKRAQS